MKIYDGLSKTLTACVLLCFLAWTEPGVAEIRAAAGHRIVTPELGVYMAGYGHNRKAEGVLDPLFLKGVLLADEATSGG